MSVSDWATTLSGFLAVAAALGATVRWAVRKYVHTIKDEMIQDVSVIVSDVVNEYLIELKPNHGSSLNDTVKLEILPLLKEMREDQINIKVDVATLTGRFDQHVVENAD
jgi:hypothetical protein